MIKIAIAQLNPTIGDLDGNASAILSAADRAAEAGVQLLLTPELSLCGYPPRDLLLNESFIDRMAKKLQTIAAQAPPSVALLVGTVTPNLDAGDRGEKPLFNTVALLHQGQIQQLFHKQLLPTYDVFDEARYFQPGGQLNQFTIELPDPATNTRQTLRIGVTICEDLWNDEEFWGERLYGHNPIADLAQAGVDLTVNLSASPFTVGKQAVREAMLQHGARRFNQPIVYANQVGGNDDLIFDGRSVALDRSGQIIYRAQGFEPDWGVIEYDPQTRDFRASAAISPALTDEAELWSALVLGVRDYVRKCRFHKIVLGLSGGIDSALVAAIAAAAIGAEQVLGLLMPSPYSSKHSVSDALELAGNLGIQTQMLPIGELMESYDRALEPLFAGTEFGVAEENLQSRIRGMLLMAVSNKFGHLLVSTGNKSEMAVGYCTLYGDMNGGLAAIADVPKTTVYQLCRWLNQQRPTIPESILTKAPSAELKPDQTDQDSLPAYEILDDILDRYLHHHQSTIEMITAGHAPETIAKIIKLVNMAEFKRKQAPPGLKVTDRAFGTGWRMPIAKQGLS